MIILWPWHRTLHKHEEFECRVSQNHSYWNPHLSGASLWQSGDLNWCSTAMVITRKGYSGHCRSQQRNKFKLLEEWQCSGQIHLPFSISSSEAEARLSSAEGTMFLGWHVWATGTGREEETVRKHDWRQRRKQIEMRESVCYNREGSDLVGDKAESKMKDSCQSNSLLLPRVWLCLPNLHFG